MTLLGLQDGIAACGDGHWGVHLAALMLHVYPIKSQTLVGLTGCSPLVCTLPICRPLSATSHAGSSEEAGGCSPCFRERSCDGIFFSSFGQRQLGFPSKDRNAA